MKKVILIIAAFVLVASGVASVSAYEAHIINVQAKVENALTVSSGDWDLGTIFPQEFFTNKWTVSLSTSFKEVKYLEDMTTPDPDARVNAVAISFMVEEKEKTAFIPGDPGDPDALPDPIPPTPPTPATYYAWMGDFMKLGTDITDDMTNVINKVDAPASGFDTYTNFADSGWTLVGARPAGTAPVVKDVLTDRILGIQPGGESQIDAFELWIGVDAPVFLPFYNFDTDVCPKPNGLARPTFEMPADDPRNNAGLGDDFGLDVKIQVTSIYKEALP